MHNILFLIPAVMWFVVFAFGGKNAADVPYIHEYESDDGFLDVSDDDISIAPMVVINGHLYYDSEDINTEPRHDDLDGKVKTSVREGQIPGIEGESNFGAGYGYRYGINDTVEVEIDGVRHIFKPD